MMATYKLLRVFTCISYGSINRRCEAFWILADYLPEHEKMPKLQAYFEHTYIWGHRRPGRNECYRSALYPIETWNHFESVPERIATTTNSIDGWHYGLQALF